MRASDVFVMSSRQEGTPIALLEAAARARPILATSCGGIPELVEHERHALLVPPGRPDLLAESLLRLARDSALRERLGEAARALMQGAFQPGGAGASHSGSVPAGAGERTLDLDVFV